MYLPAMFINHFERPRRHIMRITMRCRYFTAEKVKAGTCSAAHADKNRDVEGAVPILFHLEATVPIFVRDRVQMNYGPSFHSSAR